MTRDQVAGKVEHAMGHLKQAIGEAISNQRNWLMRALPTRRKAPPEKRGEM